MTEVLTSPLALLLLTLVAYRVGREVHERSGRHAAAQPVLVAVVLVGAVLLALDVDPEVYRDGTALLTFLLGPATVALAVPLHRQAHRLRRLALPLLVVVPLGTVASVAPARCPVTAPRAPAPASPWASPPAGPAS